jgi:predicted permease
VVDPFVPDWHAFERLRANDATFEQLAAYVERGANVTVNGESMRLGIAAVGDDFFNVAGVRPAAGRDFSEIPAHEGERLVLLSNAFWRNRFDGTPAAIGRTLTIDRVPHTIVGVLPPDFRTVAELTPNPEAAIDRTVSLVIPAGRRVIWRTMRGSDLSGRLTVVGRLRRGVTLTAGSRDVDRLFRSASSAAPAGTFSIVPVSRAVAGDLAGQLTILSVAVGVLFLVACANVANLQLERLAGRRHEFAVRTALGAGTGRLVSVALAEMVVLGLLGGAAGLLLAWGGVQAVRATATPSLARLVTLQVNGLVLTFAAAGTAVAALLSGVIPAWRISRSDPVRGMQGGSRGTALGLRGLVPAQLVVWQVAAAVVLVFAGSLLATDIARKFAFDPGFETDRILGAEVSPDRERYRRASKIAVEGEHTRYCSRLLERASHLPGVTGVALTKILPGVESYSGAGLQSEGHPLSAGVNIVSADYFSLLSIPIVAGRAFSGADVVNTGPVLVVNQALALQQWASERDAVGRQVTFWGDPRSWTVVGVSADARDEGLWRAVRPRAYVLFTQFQDDGPMNILLRSATADSTVLAKPLADLCRTLDSDQPVHRVMPLGAFVAAKLARERQIVTMMLVFAMLTLALAAIGVHGVLSYAVTMRTREIAVRRALGSGVGLIVGLVLRRSAWLLGLGVTLALPIGLVLQWYLTYVLGARAGDQGPRLMVGAVCVVALAGLVASIHSTHRAIGVEPASVLRSE